MRFIRPSNDRLNNSHTKLLLRGDVLADASPNARTVSNSGTVTVTAPSVAFHTTTVLNFPGSLQYLYVPSSADFDLLTNSFTIDGWFFKNTAVAWGGLFGRINAAGCGLTVFAGDATPTNLAVYLSSNGSTYDMAGATGLNAAFTVGVWNHFAVVRDGSLFTLYLNGAPVDTLASSASICALTTGLEIGSKDWSFVGQVSGIRFTKGVLWNKAFNPPARSL